MKPEAGSSLISDIAIAQPSTQGHTLREVVLRQPSGRLLYALGDEFSSMPFAWRFASGFHMLAILGIIGYFNEEAPLNLEQVLRDGQNEHGTPLLDAPHGMEALRKYFHAGKKLNPLYVLPPIFFVTALIVLDKLSKPLIKSKTMSAFWAHSYASVAKNFSDHRWIRDFTLDVRLLLLTWACLLPPVGITLMLLNTAYTIFRSIAGDRKNLSLSKEANLEECIRFRQQIDDSSRKPREFYNSTWFNPVIALPYICALPTVITLCIYFNLGVDELLGFPSMAPQFHTVFVIICLYIYGLSTCLTVLFMRSYFAFCWNFTSTEYDLEVYSDRIKKLPIKGWFTDFLRLAARDPGTQILWKDVASIKFRSGKLKIDNTKRDIEILQVLRKVAYFYESLANKMDIHNDYLEITNSFGRTIEIRLWELSAAEKLKLFQAIRKHCPAVYLDDKVQQALVGSAVMREPQYTQIWFEVLAGREESASKEGQLITGQILKVGRYTVSSTIASGGQAVLYLAKDADSRTVVLKEFQLTPGESFGAKIESAKDFENESAILGQLSHESIVEMLDMFYEDGRVYIVLEHVEGRTLRQVVAEDGVLTEEQILNLCKQMCSILQYLHEQNPPVVHRDFTPDNIILQPNGKIKLIDFSVAERRRKKTSDCAGKHAYTPPEQFAGNATIQSDIYALGATMYFLAVGADPTPISTSLLPNPLSSSMPDLSHVIQKCTQLDLIDRYESIEWVKNDLPSEEEMREVKEEASELKHCEKEEKEEETVGLATMDQAG